jgi:hypothetical protein
MMKCGVMFEFKIVDLSPTSSAAAKPMNTLVQLFDADFHTRSVVLLVFC